jgi:hypothetical protein
MRGCRGHQPHPRLRHINLSPRSTTPETGDDVALDVASLEHGPLTEEVLRVTGGLRPETHSFIFGTQRWAGLGRRTTAGGSPLVGTAQRVHKDVACTSRPR